MAAGIALQQKQPPPAQHKALGMTGLQLLAQDALDEERDEADKGGLWSCLTKGAGAGPDAPVQLHICVGM